MKLSTILALLSWLSLYTLSWLMILSDHFRDGIAYSFWVIFIVSALAFSARSEGTKNVD
jgi:hypothetical protein